MIRLYPYKTLGHQDLGWLDARYHFSFSGYHNRDRMGFGALRVINDDVIKAGAGFDMHGHKDMEIITYVRKGAITHRDSQGNTGRTRAGDVQVMSAGRGIYHSEFNLESEDTSLYQIWIYPRSKGGEPGWEKHQFPGKTVQNSLPVLVSGRVQDKESSALYMDQDAAIHGGRMQAGTRLDHPVFHQAYVLVSHGRAEVEGHAMNTGDGAEITRTASIAIKAIENTEIIIIDVPQAQ